jgi:poly(3-hydroxyalkanoate) depolymerase
MVSATGDAGTQFVEVRGLRLWTSVRGAGPPLLLINGIGASLELLEPIRTAFAGLQTIAFDAPGAGHSSVPWVPLSLRKIARVVEEMLSRLGFAQVDVLGVSWGGALAQEFTRLYPHRVRRLILAATSAGWIGFPPNPVAAVLIATPLRYWSLSYLECIAGRVYGGELRENPELLREHGYYRMVRPPSFTGYLGQAVALVGWTSLPWLWRLTQPTLILAGDDDPITPLCNARIMARLIPNSRLHVIEGGGHLTLLTRTDEVAPAIVDFLCESDGAAT